MLLWWAVLIKLESYSTASSLNSIKNSSYSSTKLSILFGFFFERSTTNLVCLFKWIKVDLSCLLDFKSVAHWLFFNSAVIREDVLVREVLGINQVLPVRLCPAVATNPRHSKIPCVELFPLSWNVNIFWIYALGLIYLF